MIKKLLLMIALIVAAHQGVSAAYSLVIHRNDGKNDVFALDKKPVVTFDASDMLITADGNTISIARSDIKDIDFTDSQDGIIDLETVGTLMEVVDGRTIRFNIADTSVIRVYDLSGRLATTATAVSDGECSTVSLASCPAGIYIIQYNDKSFKISIK